MTEPAITPDLIAKHGLSPDEYERILEIVGREPTFTELGIFSKLEGKGTGDWVLVDTGDVIVHVFRPEVREFYQLDEMWLETGSIRPSDV